MAAWCLAPWSSAQLLALAMLSSYVAASTFFFSVCLPVRARTCVLIAISMVIAAAPLMIPAENRGMRLIATLWAVTLWVKVFDLYAAPAHRPKSLLTWMAYLPDFLAVVWRKLPEEPRYPVGNELARLLLGAAGFGLGIVGMRATWNVYWEDKPFALEHVAKITLLFLTLTAGAYAVAAALRLAGSMARDAMNWPFFAATPADFWRDYNRPAQQFFYEDIFKKLGGWRHPLRATLLTFFVSALIHEYLFAVPIGAIQGYQTAFFMVQGLAVAATMGLRPTGAMRPLARLLTLCFMLATTVVFFASFDQLIPFYSLGIPEWLRGWTIYRW